MGCEQASDATSGTPAAAAAEAVPPAADAHGRSHHERPLPAFEGITLSGERLSVSKFIGRRLVIFFFNPEVDEAAPVAEAVASVARERHLHNFEVVGVALGSDLGTTEAFVKNAGIDFPVIDDSSGRITRQLRLRSKVALLGVDPEGYVSGLSISSFDKGVDDVVARTAKRIRESLHLPEKTGGALDQRPLAPLFETPRLDGGEPFRLVDTRGHPLVLIFFLHTCPHCHSALAFLKKELAAIPEAKRPLLIGVSLNNSASRTAVHTSLEALGLDYFEVLSDPTEVVRNQYGAFGGVPILYLIDAEGKIVHRTQGWREGRGNALLRMQLAKISGSTIPMLLNPEGYTGNDVCGVCHTVEHDSWLYTNHADAYGTLVEHAAERDPECVGCHVVGFEKPGGFSITDHPTHLENVGCESCHGRGGPHLSPDFAKGGDYAPACQGCHNPTHSLGFDYASFLPKVSHAALVALPDSERAALVEARGEVRDVLPTNADYVGSDACQGCHAKEFETFAAGPHGHAGTTLVTAGKADDLNCLRCHTTGYDRPGGFPAAGSVRNEPDLARVGCESCHGPGANHIADGARRIGTIVSLGDKCDSCVILQICGSCHDNANDPGFEFAVEEKIELQRHGTIEAGTGEPLDGAAWWPAVDADQREFFAALVVPRPLAGSGGPWEAR